MSVLSSICKINVKMAKYPVVQNKYTQNGKVLKSILRKICLHDDIIKFKVQGRNKMKLDLDFDV